MADRQGPTPGYFSVKGFDTFQHYKDRTPPWIKLYNDLLDDYEFSLLPDASKMHLVAIWLLASRYKNRIRADAGWIAKRISATEAVDLAALEQAGFIIPEQGCSILLAGCKQSAIPEREGEGETEVEREKNIGLTASPPPVGGLPAWKKLPMLGLQRVYPEDFAEFWASYPVGGADSKKSAYISWRTAANDHQAVGIMLAGARRYASYIDATGSPAKHVQTWVRAEGWTASHDIPVGEGNRRGTDQFLAASLELMDEKA